MANKTTTKKSETTQNKTSFSYFIAVLSYVAVCFGGVALFAITVLNWCGLSFSLLPIIQKFANAVAWLVVSILSFRFIKNRKKVWMWVVWTIAIVMIVLGIIL